MYSKRYICNVNLADCMRSSGSVKLNFLSPIASLKMSDKEIRCETVCSVKIIFIFILFSFLTACDVVQNEHSVGLVSSPDVDGSFSLQSENVSDLGGTRLVPLNFEQSIKLAALRSSKSQAARKVFESSLQDILASQSSKRPQVNVGLGMGGQTRGDLNALDSGAMYNLSVQKVLVDGGRSDAAEEVAQARSAAIKLELEAVLNSEAKNAAAAWARLWYSKEQASTREERAQFVLDSQLKLQKLVDAGVLDKIDQLSLDSLLEEFELATQIAQRKSDQAKIDFKFYFLDIPETIVRPSFVLKEYGDHEVDQLVLASPVIQRLKAEMAVANGVYQLARSELNPSLGSSVNVSPIQDSVDYGEANISFGLNVTYNLSDGGKRQANLSSAQKKLESSKITLQGAKESEQSRLLTDLIELDLIGLSLVRAESLLAENKLKVKSARSQLVTGKSSIRTLVGLEIDGFKLEDSILELDEQLLLARLNLVSSVGLMNDYFNIETD